MSIGSLDLAERVGLEPGISCGHGKNYYQKYDYYYFDLYQAHFLYSNHKNFWREIQWTDNR